MARRSRQMIQKFGECWNRFVSGSKIRTKLREKLIQIAKKAGIDNLTKLHTLRHTFASHLVMSGVDLPTVKKLMGHSDIQTTMIYTHLAPDHLTRRWIR
jgi:site-specific recombinase XerD